MKTLILAAVLALAAPAIAAAQARPDVVLDHDGAVDDLVALSLLIRSGQVNVRAVTLIPADSYLEPATLATRLFLDQLGARGVTLARGRFEGTHPFPAAWRADAAKMLETPALKGRRPGAANPLVAEDAAHHLVRLLSGPKRHVIVATGPLTNIADALTLDPAIAGHIERIYVMGGAVRVPGNVADPGHDGSAEWNFYNEPRAADAVIRSGVPVTLVGLDATNAVPLHRAVVERLAAQPGAASEVTSQALGVALGAVVDAPYYFWDTLTALALLAPETVSVETLKVKVITEGPSQGRTVEAADGTPIQVAVGADQAKVEAAFLRILGR